MSILNKMIADILSLSKKKKVIHEEAKRRNLDNVEQVLARDRIEQSELEIYKNEIVPALEKALVASNLNAEYQKKALDSLDAPSKAITKILNTLSEIR